MDNLNYLIQLNIEMEGLLRTIEARNSNEAKEMLRIKMEEFQILVNQVVLADVPSSRSAHVIPPSFVMPSSIPSEPRHTVVPPSVDTVQTTESAQPTTSDADSEIPLIPDNSTTHTSTTDDEDIVIPLADDQSPTQTPSVAKPVDKVEDENVDDSPVIIDFKGVFSVNDKFLFTRELFGNDKTRFKKALDKLSRMETLDQAFDYIFNTLELSDDDDTVNEFVSVIVRQFNSRL